MPLETLIPMNVPQTDFMSPLLAGVNLSQLPQQRELRQVQIDATKAGTEGQQISNLQRQYQNLSDFDRSQFEMKYSAAVQMRPFLESGDLEGVRRRAFSVIDNAKAAGLENAPIVADMQDFINILDTQGVGAAMQDMNNLLSAGQQLGLQRKFTGQQPTTKSFAPVTLIKPDTKEKILATPTYNPVTNRAELQQFDIPAGYKISTETPNERRAADLFFKSQEAETLAGVQLKTRPEIERAVTEARLDAESKAATETKQAVASASLDDFMSAYNALKDSDLDKIYGKEEKLIPEWADFFRSQEGIDLMQQRNKIIAMLELAERGKLKGQGPVTDSDAKVIKDAATALSSPMISPELARKELDRAMNVAFRSAGKPETAGKEPPVTPVTQEQVNTLLNKYLEM